MNQPVRVLTLARDLGRRKARERQHRFVAEGIRAVEELLASELKVVGALVTEHLGSGERGRTLRHALEERGIPVNEVTEADFASAAQTEHPQGVLAVAEVPDRSLARWDGPVRRILVLDAVQDPGNVGTILRTAAALGVDLTIALPGTVDLWNAKVVRGAMGAHFHHPTLTSTWEELDAFRERHQLSLWGTDAEGVSVDSIRAPERLALVVGNEGSGLGTAARQRVELLVALPIASAVESLNVSVATGIFLYLLRR